MKHIAIIFVTSLLASCNLFQRQQPVGSTEQKQREVFVPVDKELYVISHTALQYTEPDLLGIFVRKIWEAMRISNLPRKY